jgi:hypothetical protein
MRKTIPPFHKAVIDSSPLFTALTLAFLEREFKLKQIVYEVGPTDAGLMHLAHREGCILLTDDSNLYNWLGAFTGLKIELVKKLVSDLS